MPDPHSSEWEPPPPPARPPPPPPPAPVQQLGEQEQAPNSQSLSPEAIEEQVATGQKARNLQISGIVFGTAGVAGIATGFFLDQQKKSTQNEVRAQENLLELGAGDAQELDRLEAKLAREKLGSTIGFVAGGSALALGAILYLVGRKVQTRPNTGLVFSPNKHTTTIGIRGRF